MPSAQEVKKQIAQEMLETIGKLKKKLDDQKQASNKQFDSRQQELVSKQRSERKALTEKHEARQIAECQERQNRYRKGVMGLWERLSGTHKRIKKQNEQEMLNAQIRDKAEKDALIVQHIEQRKRLNTVRVQERNEYRAQKQELNQDINAYQTMLSEMRDKKMTEFNQERKLQEPGSPKQNNDRSLNR